MSAIAGIYHLNNEPINLQHSVTLMTALQKYPSDDIQTWYDENVFLGCHAQWITPESVGEQLPYHDYDSELAITADAIIDNRQELFDKLQVHYADRKGMPDSKLILLSYLKWGEECPKFLIGDFAFMIWDRKQQKLFGARDFSGSRTLYFHKNDNKFAFCTTIAPLLALPYLERNLNEEWLAEFLAISGVVDVVDIYQTVYKNVEQVPPSHSISVIRGKVTFRRYCDFSTPQKKLKLKSNEDYVEALQEVLQEAIVSRVRTYRQVGAHLSGGLDSGSVVSYASKALEKEKKALQTFSSIPAQDFVDFTPKSKIADERPFIQATAQHIGGIKVNYLDFSGKSPLTELDDFLDIMEMPYKFFENSIWLKGIFYEASKSNIGVLLNGGRGNFTISWGPALEYQAELLKKIKWFRFYQELHLYSKNIGENKLKLLPIIGKIAFPFINKYSPLFVTSDSPNIINPELAVKTRVFEKLNEQGIHTDSSSIPNVYTERKKHFEKLYHWNATNTLSTKLSLRYSLWKRDPTNDLRVVRFCLSVPENQYVKNGLDRALIRNAMMNLLPDKVRLNQSVRGVQGVDWVYRMIPSWNVFIEELNELKNDSEIFRFLNPQVVKAAISKVSEQPPLAKYAIQADYRISMRSLIVYRFMQKFLKGGDNYETMAKTRIGNA
ncbi:lasso peptide isopeptide bond-forming cyclase [Bacillus sp. JJ634]